MCSVLGESCRSVPVHWTLCPVNSPIYFSRPEYCPWGCLTPSSSQAPGLCLQERGYGSTAPHLGGPRREPLHSLGACVGGRQRETGRAGRAGSAQAALLLLLFSCLMQSEQEPERARSPTLLCGLKLPSPTSGEAFLNSENKQSQMLTRPQKQ